MGAKGIRRLDGFCSTYVANADIGMLAFDWHNII